MSDFTNASTPLRVGVIGCGAISNQYLGMAEKFPNVRIVAAADLDLDRAKSKAAEYKVPRACTPEQLLGDDSIELVLNLTIPAAHVPLGLQAIQAGKHTYCEKPLGLDRDEARKLLDAAGVKNLRVGSAPDTWLGSAIQTAKHLINDGVIGTPVACTAFMLGRGHEHWHPAPEFYYKPGGGPMLDMGPYYLTALAFLLGPMTSVAGMVSITRPTRTVTSKGPHSGKTIDVEAPDHVVGTVRFENGCIASVLTSFGTRAAEYNNQQPIQIFGTEGTLRVNDPNQFDGPVSLCRFSEGEDKFEVVEPRAPTGYGRAVGLADMADAIRHNRPHRCSGELAYHVLDAMQGFTDSSRSGTFREISSGFELPAVMPNVFGTF